MPLILHGSLCYNDIIEQAKKQHSAFSRGKNGKGYVAITIFINDNPDEYGNDAAIKLNSTKEARDKEPSVYLGNLKFLNKKDGVPVHTGQGKPKNKKGVADDDLPF